MFPSRLVLVEHLDAPGASAADARTRAGLLQQAGFDVWTFVCDPGGDGATDAERLGTRLARVGTGRAALAGLRDRVAAIVPHLVVVAGAEPGGGAPAQALDGVAERRWWPTACADGAGSGARVAALAGEADALAWGVGDPERGARARLPLWDGDFVLAPVALAGRAGEELIRGFARSAGSDDGVDLVVLDDPAPEFEALARELGVGMRVHFAGAAPREAEFAWWSSARAAVFAGERPFAAGMVWRALGCGCPLLVAGEEPVPAALRAWLAAQGCLAGGRARGEEALGESLDDLMARGGPPAEAAERGRALARAHHARLPARLAAALGAREGERAA